MSKLHSEAYFGETRDWWWNLDYLSIVAQRLRFSEAKSVLDVGAGVGHWGRILSRFLSEGAHVVGVDREEAWVTEAIARAPRSGVSFEYRLGRAEGLPFPDSSFDIVTCQTLLIHVQDPLQVIGEMLRVTRPGGLILLVEPNNLSASLSLGTALFERPIVEIVELVRLQLTCERGKAALGEGNNSVGELIPGLLVQAGATDVEVCQSDKAFALVPPYVEREQAARAEEALAFAASGFWIWERAETERYFLAGGGTAEDFVRLWAVALLTSQGTAQGIRERTFHAAGAGTTYLVSGRKPADP